MATTPPKDIFKACKNNELFVTLLKTKLPQADFDEANSENRKFLIDELVKLTTSTGIHMLLSRVLKMNTLKLLAGDKADYGGKKSISRATLCTVLEKLINAKNLKKFFEARPTTQLVEVLKDMDVEIPESKKDYATAILQEIDNLGIDNLLSSLGSTKLKQFAVDSGLAVETNSVDIIIDSILHQTNYEARKKESPKNRPPIDNKIEEDELVDNYLRPELVKFCEEHDVLHIGTKQELAKRILDFLNNEPFPKRSEYIARQQERKKKTMKSKEEKSQEKSEEKSEKSEDKSEEKSEEKSETPKKKQKQKQQQQEEEKEEKEHKQTTSPKRKTKKTQEKEEKSEEEKEKEKEEKEKEKEKEKEEKTKNKKQSKKQQHQEEAEEEAVQSSPKKKVASKKSTKKEEKEEEEEEEKEETNSKSNKKKATKKTEDKSKKRKGTNRSKKEEEEEEEEERVTKKPAKTRKT